MKLAALTFVALLPSCGLFADYPDRRDALVVTHDPTLARHAQFAIDWWDAATGEVTSELSDSCRSDKVCVYMTWDNLPEPDGGWNQNWDNIVTGESGSRIKIDIAVENGPNLRHVVAHELGHSMEMPHVSSDIDLMRPNGYGPSCIATQSLNNWRMRYGNSSSLKVVCSFELDEAK